MVNKKDYKAIAEIMNIQGRVLKLYNLTNHIAINQLADYFEKKEYEFVDINGKQVRGKWEFDRQQFLKDCGVA